jgi:hypothetical protein
MPRDRIKAEQPLPSLPKPKLIHMSPELITTSRLIPLSRVDLVKPMFWWKASDSKIFWTEQLFPKTEAYYNVDIGLIVFKGPFDILVHPAGVKMTPKLPNV